MSHVTCHVSRVMCHLSRVTCHVSHVPCHMSFIYIFYYFFFYVKKNWQIGGASRWRVGPQQNQGNGFYREAVFTEWSCVCTLPPDQEEAPAWQRQSGPGAERDSCSYLGMGLTGTGSGACWAETVQRGSREIFLVLFGNGKQEQDLTKMYHLSILEII